MITVAKYDLEGNFLELLEGKDKNAIAVREKVDFTSLKRVLQGTNYHVNGFQYRLLRPDKTYPALLPPVWEYRYAKVRKSSYGIGKYYNGKFITSYRSLNELAVKNFGVKMSNISKALNNNKEFKHVSGFTFKKIE